MATATSTVREWEEPEQTRVSGQPPGPDVTISHIGRGETRRQDIRAVNPLYKSGTVPGVPSATGVGVHISRESKIEPTYYDTPDYRVEKEKDSYQLRIIDPKVEPRGPSKYRGSTLPSHRSKTPDFPSTHSKRSFLKLSALEPRRSRKRSPLGELTSTKNVHVPDTTTSVSWQFSPKSVVDVNGHKAQPSPQPLKIRTDFSPRRTGPKNLLETTDTVEETKRVEEVERRITSSDRKRPKGVNKEQERGRRSTHRSGSSKSYSSKEFYGPAEEFYRSNIAGTQSGPIVEFPPTLPRSEASCGEGYSTKRGLRRDYEFQDKHSRGRREWLLEPSTFEDGWFVDRNYDGLSKLEKEFREASLAPLPTQQNMNRREFRQELLPHGQESLSRQVKAASGTKGSNNRFRYHPMATPGEILSEPAERIWFNGPFIDKYRVCVRFTNDGARPIAWMLKTNAPNRLSGSPANGVIQPKQNTILYITCEPFDIASSDTSADRITVEWTVAKGNNFVKEWFQDDGAIIRRKNIPVQYNS